MPRVNLMTPEEIIHAVRELCGNAFNHTSYANIAKFYRPRCDTHRRDYFYNSIVDTVKDCVRQGLLRFVEVPIAGHPAKIALPIPPRRRQARGETRP